MRARSHDYDDLERDAGRLNESAVSSPGFIAPAFVRAVARDVLAYFASTNTPIQGNVRSHLAKFWATPPNTIHYELWLHERRNLIELGLHFEADAVLNDRLYAYFAGCLLEIQERLGDTVWVEPWDKGWTRLYEVRPMRPMTDERVADTAARMCELIECLQPYLDRYFAAHGEVQD